MMMFGSLFILLFVGILFVGLVAGLAWLNKNNSLGNPFSVNQPPEKREQIPSPNTKRICSHCGTGLQASWTHCPQCGAPVGS